MSRIFHRPMFRTGGSSNNGITSGLRSGYDNGGPAKLQKILSLMDAYAPEPELPNTNTPEIICPPNEAPIAGSKVEGNKKISGYEIQNGRCITLYEEVPIVEQVIEALPTAGAVTTTASIALVATTSAVLAKPLADVILKAIKPLIKTAMKKIQKLLGKNPEKLSRSEIVANQYRQKKDLPPLKKKKEKK